MAIPTKDALLLDWSANMALRLGAAPEIYGITPEIAAGYAAAHAALAGAQDKLLAARAAGTRSESLTALRNAARQALLRQARPLYKRIQASGDIPEAAKIELGVHIVDAKPTSIPVPALAPGLSVLAIDGRRMTLRLFDPARPEHRRLPDGVDGAVVLSHIGPAAPADLRAFQLETLTARTTLDIHFPDSAPPGTRVWLTARFFNQRKQMGPASPPISAIVNYGGPLLTAA